MHFVTLKRTGYVLFSTTPSGRVAVGLTENPQRVHLLFQQGGQWSVVRDWPVEEFSHTDVMLELGKVDEPADPEGVLSLLPPPQSLH
jgi:hypothetical protein